MITFSFLIADANDLFFRKWVKRHGPNKQILTEPDIYSMYIYIYIYSHMCSLPNTLNSKSCFSNFISFWFWIYHTKYVFVYHKSNILPQCFKWQCKMFSMTIVLSKYHIILAIASLPIHILMLAIICNYKSSDIIRIYKLMLIFLSKCDVADILRCKINHGCRYLTLFKKSSVSFWFSLQVLVFS